MSILINKYLSFEDIENIEILKNAGVDIVVAGSYVFGSDDYEKAIKSLKI